MSMGFPTSYQSFCSPSFISIGYLSLHRLVIKASDDLIFGAICVLLLLNSHLSLYKSIAIVCQWSTRSCNSMAIFATLTQNYDQTTNSSSTKLLKGTSTPQKLQIKTGIRFLSIVVFENDVPQKNGLQNTYID